MKYFFSLWLLLVFYDSCGQDYKVLLQTLNRVIAQAPGYDRQKEDKINRLKTTLGSATLQQLFDRYESLYEEYKIFNYDSAYSYAQKELNTAQLLHNDSFITSARTKLGFILLSSGMFKEAFDSLNTIKVQNLRDKSKLDYYLLMARCYYDLADYTMDAYHTPLYNKRGNEYLDAALTKLSPESFDFLYYNGLKNIRAGKLDSALSFFKKLIIQPALSLHQIALTTSTMSDIYIQTGQTDSALSLLVKAAKADIQSSTKETSALFNLSSMLFRLGDLKNASTYIEKAVKDAVFYGARQRKVQMSTILPLIEGEKIARVENDKKTLITYSVIVTILFLILIYLTIIVARQIRKLKKAQNLIGEAHAKQQEINTRLLEANKIKEEYIGFFFNANTAFYDKITRFKKNVDQKIADRKLDEIRFLVNSLDIRQERNDLLQNFDSIFLKLFPHFITEFNSFFKPEDIIPLSEGEVLNTDLRIFALIRLGIHDNNTIAHILGYSVNTINTYKTRIKNKSLVPNEEFELKIMEIKSV